MRSDRFRGGIIPLALAVAAPMAGAQVIIPPTQVVSGIPGQPGTGLKGAYYKFGPPVTYLSNLAQANQLIAASGGPTATFLTTTPCFPDCNGDTVFDSSPLTALLNGHVTDLAYASPNGPSITSSLNLAAMVLTGYVAIPHAGTYTFSTGSDDGSTLSIGGQTIVLIDGTHSFEYGSGSASFSAPGLYPITAEYFENNDRTGFEVLATDNSTGRCFIGHQANCQGTGASTALYGKPGDQSILYNFTGSATAASADGANPAAQLTADLAGALYGVTTAGGANLCKTASGATASCGTLFKLTPPTADGGLWTETVLYDFQQKYGWGPKGPLILNDAAGTIVGTAPQGGQGCQPAGCGVVYALTLSATGKQAKETTLHNFDAAGDGRNPNPTLASDSSGALYGSTRSGGLDNKGVIFKLTPPVAPGGGWSYAVIYRFTGASDGGAPNDIAIDSTGAIYGTTSQGGAHHRGIAYQLVPPATSGAAWTLNLLHDFAGSLDGGKPLTGVVLDAGGVVYGATSEGGGKGCGGAGCGVVFSLAPGQTGWTLTTLHPFKDQPDGAHPVGALTLAVRGPRLYGVTSGGGAGEGTVFELRPHEDTPAGQWDETVLYSFAGAPDGAAPGAGFYDGAAGVLYGTTSSGGANGAGAIYKITPP